MFAAVSTVQAFHNFQQQHELVKVGNVDTIRPWMTVPYIAHVYHVPINYLYRSLNITDPHSSRNHVTLHALALHYQRPVDSVIHDVQKAILTYRKQHPSPAQPRPVPTQTRPTPTHRKAGIFSGIFVAGRMVY